MSAEISGFRRFLHWGPITALSIIKCITLTTLYMNSMWWPPNESFAGFAHQALFLLLSTLATFNYVMATLTGPGLMPKQWQPKDPKDAEFLQYCKKCEGYKAPRSHHCRKCDRCVKKMDHHCPWINHCVGWANHAYFTYFLLFSILGSLQGTVVLCCSFWRGIYRYYYLTHGLAHLASVQFTLASIIMCILGMGLAIGVVIGLSMLLFIQLKTIVTNQTGIEIWIVEKAIYRRYRNPDCDDEFLYPYDLGWRQNLRLVFNDECQKRGDGIEWPVVKGCDQYTLTREQLAQKEEKRARTRTFRCIRPVTGRWLPIFSQGWRVCVSAPCSDEPRIRLRPDDIIRVTRFRNHWLFGERVPSEEELTGDKKRQRKGHIRGWFPRRSAVEVIEAVQECSGDSNSEEPASPAQNGNAHNHLKQQQRNGHAKKYM
ncbi:palmitoyltransferase ZDHHC6 [Drosophila eugracilis]|uniref:palmitoyltransferase ZDHHC6 n=1 Tax=Drosophila eugracilis TaxID=29029 RepID=UPI001BDB0370|nr:palmitoyltransferase ZDHHC6 [Drosophila eugracilis]